MISVILSGGSGTRLWPFSRKKLPKQFIKLNNGRSLFQEALLRNTAVCSEYLIVSGREQAFLVKDDIEEQGANLSRFRFLFEPVGRNTAPAVALACMMYNPDDILLVVPSDHLISDLKKYSDSVALAVQEAKKGCIVTFGIKPDRPETGYGYIEAVGIDVKSFKEKPDYETAKEYMRCGNYYWNSGMFCFRVDVMLNELRRYAPQVYDACIGVLKCENREFTVDINSMQAIPSISIDYAVMEKSNLVKVIPSDFGWSDLGSFESIYDISLKDADNNAVFPPESASAVIVNSKNNLLLPSKRKITLIDVDGLIVADTTDALLISKQGASQKVRNVVEELEKSPDTCSITEVSDFARRPWGNFTVLEDRNGYKIKQITVKPHKRLSLQKHFHRSEHWVVVSGEALVTIGETQMRIKANESTYIQQGQLHRLENPCDIDLVIVEVQVGSYTGEDDIIRFEDDHGRK